jgi:hypothetical protein
MVTKDMVITHTFTPTGTCSSDELAKVKGSIVVMFKLETHAHTQSLPRREGVSIAGLMLRLRERNFRASHQQFAP